MHWRWCRCYNIKSKVLSNAVARKRCRRLASALLGYPVELIVLEVPGACRD